MKSARKAEDKLHKACERASEIRERTLHRQEQNRMRIASMSHETVYSQHTSTITCTDAPRVWHFSAFHSVLWQQVHENSRENPGTLLNSFMILLSHNLLCTASSTYVVIRITYSQSSKERVQKFMEFFDILSQFVPTIENRSALKTVLRAPTKALVSRRV